ncbi:ZIP family metal transporter [Nitrosopumilus sp.]|uniref:ZIP family metal transporter n=1 Tax=Nitrosopumilus sp. TaxID=2024843 RepID=UPI003B5ADC00
MSLENAIVWSFASSIPLILGATITRFLEIDRKIVAIIMAVGSGSLISIITFSLMREAYHLGGVVPVSIGFAIGVVIFGFGNRLIIKKFVIKRKNQDENKPTKGSGLSLALGSLLDNIPEGLSIGVTILISGTIGFSLVIAIAISNFAEALAGSNIMKIYKKNSNRILVLWGIVTASNVTASALGFMLLSGVDDATVAILLSFAAGAILGMLAETMMPEVFKLGGSLISLATAAGFLISFIMIIQNVYPDM